MKIVMIDQCSVHENRTVQDAEPVEVDVRNGKEAREETKIFIGRDQTLTHFWGTWEDKRVMFICNDNGIALGLRPNKQATIAYLGECIPGTMHVIVGPVVALMHKDLW